MTDMMIYHWIGNKGHAVVCCAPLHHLRLLHAVLAITLCFTSFICFASSDKNTLFREAKLALAAANSANANILAPKGYSEGSKYFQRAEVLFAKQRALSKIQKELANAQVALNQASKHAELAQLTLAAPLKARSDAKSVDAQRLAGDIWREAEKALLEAATRLEGGNLKRAKRLSSDAEQHYRTAELTAIKASYLQDARQLINKANDEKVYRYTPKTLQKAEELLALAEKELTENRYDIDYPRTLAKQARYEAKHALALSELVKALDRSTITPEEFLLKLEAPLISISNALDMIASFDEGFDTVADDLVSNIESLRADAYELGERRKELARLENEMASLEQRMGIQSQRVAEQEAQKESLRKLNDLFNRDEASVLTEGRNILIRAVGLTFSPGSAQINSQNFALLQKLKTAIALYPRYTLLIEGHTDSFGSNSANLNLSFARAESVKAYLRANIDSAKTIEAIGYGETHPIANNETQEGRTRNRRIDFVLRPPL